MKREVRIKEKNPSIQQQIVIRECIIETFDEPVKSFSSPSVPLPGISRFRGVQKKTVYSIISKPIRLFKNDILPSRVTTIDYTSTPVSMSIGKPVTILVELVT